MNLTLRRWHWVAGALAAVAIGGGIAAVAVSQPGVDRHTTECRSYTSAGESIEGSHVGVAAKSMTLSPGARACGRTDC